MEEIKVKLSKIIKRTPTVQSFRFIPRENLSFIPGQFLQVADNIERERHVQIRD